MRGAPHIIGYVLWDGRIIPAYAGSTLGVPLGYYGTGDHPRVCGEHFILARIPLVGRGSSPRMRGAPASPGTIPSTSGIIPAYAGSTSTIFTLGISVWDHPRVCGEHCRAFQDVFLQPVSSPRMRGAQGYIGKGIVPIRIIPAYAGSTWSGRTRHRVCGDHPRVCGEHLVASTFADCRSGSSPRMRGAPGFLGNEMPSLGIIPAYAGSTPWDAPARCAASDHPRVCGQHGSRGNGPGASGGSSPRMRGALIDNVGKILDLRIIPAYAGSTCSRFSG